MRPSVALIAFAGTVTFASGGVAILALRSISLGRPMLSAWDDLILIPFVLAAAWVVVNAMYGAEMNGRVNDQNRAARRIKAALREAFEEAKADDPDLPEPTEETLDRAAGVIRLDLYQREGVRSPRHFIEAISREDARADAELGGLKPPSDKDA